MSSVIAGTWNVQLRTPIGNIPIELFFDATGGDLTGSATSKSETVELHEIRCLPGDEGLRVSWKQSITKPMRLNLDFDVVITDDQMSGSSRAGRLPKSSVSGARVGAAPSDLTS